MRRIKRITDPFRQPDVPGKTDQDQRQGKKAVGFQPHEGFQRIGKPGRQVRQVNRDAEQRPGEPVSGTPEQEKRGHYGGNAGAAALYGIQQDEQGDAFPAVIRFQDSGQNDGGSREKDSAQPLFFPDAP